MTPQNTPSGSRRPLKSREKGWAHVVARWAKSAGFNPNSISILSIVFSFIAAVCLMTASDVTSSKVLAAFVWLGAIAGIQLRLLCNLIDGMVAIEGGMKSPVGGLFNEVPDRVADTLILVAAGYSNEFVVKLGPVPLGWVAATLAMMTAYIRTLGGSLTGTQSFAGPMSKQHRMFILSLACFGAIVEQWISPDGKVERAMQVALTVIIGGAVITCIRRLLIIAKQLRQNSAKP